MTSFLRIAPATTVMLMSISGIVAQEPFGSGARFEDMTSHVPETANAVVVIDASGIFDSAFAKREDWPDTRAERFASGATSIPPHAKRLVLAANLDADVMRATWEVSIMELDEQPDHRQQISSWVKRLNRGRSPYLKESIADLDAKAQVIMAMDLENAFSTDDIARGLGRFESVEKSQLDKAAVAKLLASIKGVTLEINFGDKSYGLLRLDFSADATLVSSIAKPLAVERLNAYGVMVDDVADWKVEVHGNRISLTGAFTENGLTRVNRLIHLPSPALHAHAQGEASSPPVASDRTPSATPSATPKKSQQTQPKTPLEATQAYFKIAEMLLQDLKREKREMQTVGQLAQWMDGYAVKLDRLPTLHVDPEMLAFGRYISMQLHNGSLSLKGIGIQEGVSEVNAANSSKIYGGALGNISQNNWQSGDGSVGGNYGRRVETNAAYGVAQHFGVYGAAKSSIRQANQATTQVQIQSPASAGSTMVQIQENIETADAQIRQSMTDKYQVQF